MPSREMASLGSRLGHESMNLFDVQVSGADENALACAKSGHNPPKQRDGSASVKEAGTSTLQVLRRRLNKSEAMAVGDRLAGKRSVLSDSGQGEGKGRYVCRVVRPPGALLQDQWAFPAFPAQSYERQEV